MSVQLCHVATSCPSPEQDDVSVSPGDADRDDDVSHGGDDGHGGGTEDEELGPLVRGT